ncbi:MAG TPA: hypothetical protein VHY91_20715 [Pirellulales bacterium]|jgi:hypothetical protein|nr:hypothetical protein [Pirellulales bacterium]
MVLATLSAFTLAGNVHGGDDGWRETLREGIEARESAIHSLRIKYAVVTELTELHEAMRKRALEKMAKHGTRSREEVDRLLKHPPSPTSTTKYKLVTSDGKIASSSADVAPDGQGQSIRRVFDGEILTALQGDGLGTRMRATPEDALPETTIDSLCQIDDFSLQEFLADPKATSTLLPQTAGDEDVVFQVTLTTEKDSETGGQWEIIADINATKSFWPQHLVETVLSNAEGEPQRFIMQEVRCSDFQTTGGIDIPGKIEKNISSMSVGGVVRRITLLVDQIAINEPIDASEFVLTFPPGTSYLDLDGEQKIVDPDWAIERLAAKIAKQYPVTDDTRNEQAWSSGPWQWVGATTFLLAVVSALYSLRYLRARRST